MSNDDNQDQANDQNNAQDETSSPRGRRRRGGRRRRSESTQEVEATSTEQASSPAPSAPAEAAPQVKADQPKESVNAPEAEDTKEAPATRRRRGGRRRRRQDEEPEEASVNASSDETSKTESSPAQDAPKEQPAAQSAPAQAKAVSAPKETRPSAPKPEEKPALRPAQYQKQGRVWLETLFEHMNLNVTPKGSYNKDTKTLNFDLEGEDRNVLLGRNNTSPRSLENIQKLLFEALSLHSTKYNVHVDVDHFRTTRTERLEALAQRLAKKSKGINRAFVVAGLNDFERRVVHQVLTISDEVKTESQGVGIFRKLRIEPSEA